MSSDSGEQIEHRLDIMWFKVSLKVPMKLCSSVDEWGFFFIYFFILVCIVWLQVFGSVCTGTKEFLIVLQIPALQSDLSKRTK